MKDILFVFNLYVMLDINRITTVIVCNLRVKEISLISMR
jgi:hypothetical protein